MGKRLSLLERAENVRGLKQDEHGVWRDQWDRPALWRKDGKGRAPYLRASKVGEELESRKLLEAWGERKVAEGVGMNEHLQVAVQTSWRNRERMNEICDEAKMLAKAKERAVKGTAEHHFFDDIDLDRPTDRPRHLDGDAEAYTALTRPRLEHLHVEQFVACDTWCGSLPVFIAGRPDRASRLRVDVPFPRSLWEAAGRKFMPAGECVIVDNKTGAWVDFAQLSWGLQFGAYANGDPYDLALDERFEWIQRPRTDWALVVHTPYGQGESRLYWLNIGKAWTYLVIAISKRNAQAQKDQLLAPVPKAHVMRSDARMDW
jgi:hypothetical protein